jgi:hypothetical protein
MTFSGAVSFGIKSSMTMDAWTIENFHRRIKQFSGIERGQAHSRRAQRNYMGLALRALLRLEVI